jgi:hypothetical protein
MRKKPATLRRPKNMALFELQRFIDFLRAVDQELSPDELTLVAAFIVHGLPGLFTSSPAMLNQIKDIAQAIKNKRN